MYERGSTPVISSDSRVWPNGLIEDGEDRLLLCMG